MNSGYGTAVCGDGFTARGNTAAVIGKWVMGNVSRPFAGVSARCVVMWCDMMY